MQATAEKGAPTFRGSISRRFTLLSVHILAFVAIVGALSVYKAHRIARLHTEIGELGAHIEVLERLETAIFRLRAESQDALFLGEAFDDPGLDEIPRQIRQQWKLFEQLHSRDGHPWETGTSLERPSTRNWTRASTGSSPLRGPSREEPALRVPGCGRRRSC